MQVPDTEGRKLVDVDDTKTISAHFSNKTSLKVDSAISSVIAIGGFGAYNAEAEDAPEGFYLVEWLGVPFETKYPQKVEGCTGGLMPVGTRVCRGRYWDRISRAPGWYSRNTAKGRYVFLTRYVLSGNLSLVPYDQLMGDIPPNRAAMECDNPESNVKKILHTTMREVNHEKFVRSKLEHEHEIDERIELEENDDDSTETESHDADAENGVELDLMNVWNDDNNDCDEDEDSDDIRDESNDDID